MPLHGGHSKECTVKNIEELILECKAESEKMVEDNVLRILHI